MNKKVKTLHGIVNLTDKNFLAAGGEGQIYVNGGKAFKIYHDIHKALSPQKIKELSVITEPSVIIPKDIIYDISTGDVIGYVTDFIDGADPLLMFFTKTFKQANNLSNSNILDLVKKMYLVTSSVHSLNILLVDYNELNILVKINGGLKPYFIDTDSYQTQNFRSEVVMNSIMDRKCSKMVHGHLAYNPNIYSDWFSWGILSFWVLTGIHPFRGRHPLYKPNQMVAQMDAGVSVFDSKIKLPPSVSSFSSVIPKPLLDWYIDEFKNGNRSIPPLPDGTYPTVVPAAVVMVKGNNQIDVIQVAAYSENVVSVIQSMGLNYVVTTKGVYCDDKLLMGGCDKSKKTLLCSANDGTIIVGSLSAGKMVFTELNRQREIGTIACKEGFSRNNCIYTVSGNGRLILNKFTTIGDKVLHRVSEVENLSVNSITVFDGCVIQNLLGKHFIVIPNSETSCFSKYLPQLDGYRVIGAKSERNATVIIAERKGPYDKFIIVFNKDYSNFDVRKVDDVVVDTINFTVTDKGLCILLDGDDLTMFVNNQRVEVLNDAPLDASMKLFSTSDGVFFINGNTIHQIKRK